MRYVTIAESFGWHLLKGTALRLVPCRPKDLHFFYDTFLAGRKVSKRPAAESATDPLKHSHPRGVTRFAQTYAASVVRFTQAGTPVCNSMPESTG